MGIELKQISKQVAADTHIHPTDLVLDTGVGNIRRGTTGAGKTTGMAMITTLI